MAVQPNRTLPPTIKFVSKIFVFYVLPYHGAELKSFLCLSGHNKFGAKIKIMWEEQLVDSPIHYLTCVIVP